MERNSNKLSKLPQNILRESVQEKVEESDIFLRSIEEANERISEIPKERVMAELMSRLEAQAIGRGSLIPMEEIDQIGIALIENYCSLEETARQLNMPLIRLKFLIRELDELQVYYELAQEGIKSLTDSQVIKMLRTGDPDVLKMVYNKMYSGRAKGAFNPSEIGTTGYNDKLGKRLADETADDRKSSKVEVQFNFFKKEIRTEFEQIEVEGQVVDGDTTDESK